MGNDPAPMRLFSTNRARAIVTERVVMAIGHGRIGRLRPVASDRSSEFLREQNRMDLLDVDTRSGAVSPSGTSRCARSWCTVNGTGGIGCRHAAHWHRVWYMRG